MADIHRRDIIHRRSFENTEKIVTNNLNKKLQRKVWKKVYLTFDIIDDLSNLNIRTRRIRQFKRHIEAAGEDI